MKPVVEVIDHQRVVEVPHAWREALATSLGEIAEVVRRDHATGSASVLSDLDSLEVALVDDSTSARVHEDFMGIAGPTDVITFDHGEVVVGIEIAVRQAEAHGEPLWREVLRYLIHGVLHLAGHEDASDEARAAMERVQEALVAEYWPRVEATAARSSEES